jgi:magnesium transporter
MSAPAEVMEALQSRLAGEDEKPYAEIFAELRPEEIAGCLRELPDRDVEQVFSGLRAESHELSAQVLPLLERHDIRRLLAALPSATVADVLEELPPDDATWVLELLPEGQVPSVVESMDAPEREEVVERLEYPEGSAGRLMSSEYIALPAEATAGDAILRLQQAGEDVTIVYVYLVDSAGRLGGVVSLRQLLRVKPDRPLRDMSPTTDDVVSVGVADDQEHVAQVVARSDFVCIPVVDEDGRLAGVVTHDDVLDVMREEATEDMLQMAGTTPDDVIAQSVWTSARIRMPWLMVAFLIEMVAMAVVNRGEKRLGDVFVVVALFMPAISAMCGNVAVQASTIVVRGLATGRIQRHDAWPVAWRELRTTLLMAATYGAFLAVVSWTVLDQTPAFGLVVGSGLVTSMVMASAFGSLVPIVFHVVKVDPAVATGPLVTTSMDVLAFGTFLALAAWLLVA